ncbi:MAG: hypothetical protein ABIJ09_14485 [Pseudomonadota bacterium]
MLRLSTHRAGLQCQAWRTTAAALVLAVSTLAVPGRAADDTFDADLEQGVETVQSPGFFGTFFPFFPASDLPEPVADAKVMIYLLNLLPFGGLWGPLVAIDKEGRPEVGGDVVLPWLVPTLTGGACQVCGFAGIGVGLVVGAIVATASGGPGILCVPCFMTPGCLISLLGWPLQLWIAPTAAVNAWGRAYTSRDKALPEPAPPAPTTPGTPETEPPSTPAPPAQAPAGEWGPAEPPQAPEQPAAPAVPKKPDPKKPADNSSSDDSEWVPY